MPVAALPELTGMLRMAVDPSEDQALVKPKPGLKAGHSMQSMPSRL